MNELIIILKVIMLSRVITKFQPLSWILESLPSKIGLFKWIPIVITSCWKCCSLWVSIIMTGDIFLSSGIFIIVSTLDLIEQKIIEKLWLKK